MSDQVVPKGETYPGLVAVSKAEGMAACTKFLADNGTQIADARLAVKDSNPPATYPGLQNFWLSDMAASCDALLKKK